MNHFRKVFIKPSKKIKIKKRNVMPTTFLQQIISGRLLLIVIVGAKKNLSDRFKFEPITINHL